MRLLVDYQTSTAMDNEQKLKLEAGSRREKAGAETIRNNSRQGTLRDRSSTRCSISHSIHFHTMYSTA
jgi:hypothetical protein